MVSFTHCLFAYLRLSADVTDDCWDGQMNLQ